MNRDLSGCWDKLTCESESLHMQFVYVASNFQAENYSGKKPDLTEDWLKNILQAIILLPWEYINDTLMFRYYCSDGLELLIQHVRLYNKEKSYCLSDLEAEAPLNWIEFKSSLLPSYTNTDDLASG